MNVSAVIVTRGDVELDGIIESLPKEWEVVIWDNGERQIYRSDGWAEICPDVAVYGRYAAIEHASHDLIYVQDDDVIVSDPQTIVREWHRVAVCSPGPDGCEYDGEDPCYQCGACMHSIVANMPQEFRHDGYTDSCLVGFGACFHRDAADRAFVRYNDYWLNAGSDVSSAPDDLAGWFHRTCDVVFTTLTPRVLVDVPKKNLPCSNDPNRMWKQPDHVGERTRMLELVRKVRDA